MSRDQEPNPSSGPQRGFFKDAAVSLSSDSGYEVSKCIDDEDKERAEQPEEEKSGKLMSDIQFLVLLATITLCTVWIVFVVARAAKAICEHVVRAANMLRESERWRHHAE
jgi:hypothetical protein